MSRMTDVVWNMLKDAISQAKIKDEQVCYDDAAKSKFEALFHEKYEFVKENFMKESVETLDRHKVASIIIASLIETDVISYSGEVSQEQTFFGKYLIAVSVGLSYMQSRLNEILIKGNQPKIDRYLFPTAFSCTTPYFAIFARNLYFTHEKTNWQLNLLDMSEILFLIEYLTLVQKGIDINVLVEELGE